MQETTKMIYQLYLRGVVSAQTAWETIVKDMSSDAKEVLKNIPSGKYLEAQDVVCRHEWVDVGFMMPKMVCKKCNFEKDSQ